MASVIHFWVVSYRPGEPTGKFQAEERQDLSYSIIRSF